MSTLQPWNVRPAWTRGRDGGQRRCGWHLMCGDEWAQTYSTKREAKLHADRFNGIASFEQCRECASFDPDALCPQCKCTPAHKDA